MDISKMTAEERAELKAQLDEQEKQEAARKQAQREAYEAMKEEFISRNLIRLKALSDEMMQIKRDIFADAAALIEMKDELFKTKTDRQSNSFTTGDGRTTIMLGNRINEGWDDTCDQGIEKVKAYLATLAKDENSAALVDTVMRLMAKNNKGVLKASKVLELEKLASKVQDPDFLEGIAIIKASYRPTPTCQFITVKQRNEEGNDVIMPLSLSQC